MRASLALAALAAGWLIAAQAYAQCSSAVQTPVPPRRPEELAFVQQTTAAIQKAPAPILLFGDSFAAQWAPYFPRPQSDLGYPGDRVENMLWRLDQIPAPVPGVRLIVVIAGANDSGGRFSGCQVGEGVLTLTRALKAKFPGARVLVLSMTPRGANLEQSDDLIRQSNAYVAAASAKLGFTFIDTYAAMRKQCGHSEQCPLIRAGLLHLTPDGYQMLNGLIQPYLP